MILLSDVAATNRAAYDEWSNSFSDGTSSLENLIILQCETFVPKELHRAFIAASVGAHPQFTCILERIE